MKKLVYISLIMCTMACTSRPKINAEQLIQKTLEKRIADFKTKEFNECRENAILEAEIYVDSVIYQMTRFSILDDSLSMISKPHRPDRPEYIEITDPGPIQPYIFNY